ncbi:MAG: GntR family transcriptional regulator, partial [Thermaurantiacus sp.]
MLIATAVEGLDNGSAEDTLVDRIANALAAEIFAGRLRPGERIRHEVVAARHKVSLGPVREALLKLERGQLVQIQPRRGARVIELSVEWIEDMMAMRLAVFPVMMHAAIARGSDDALESFAEVARELVMVLRSDAPLDRIVRCSDLACRQLYVAGEARWAAEVLTAVSKQLRWVSHRLTVETKEEKAEAANAWAQLWPPVVQRDSGAADLAAQRMLMRAVYTVLPKFYR